VSIQLLKKVAKKILGRDQNSWERAITVYPKHKKAIGRVLFSYLEQAVLWKPNDIRFNAHSNLWESREIVRIFNSYGFIVDCINWNNRRFWPKCSYDIVFDIHVNLQRLTPVVGKETKKLLHLTTSHVWFSRDAELKRVHALEQRTKAFYTPKRIVDYLDWAERSLRLADTCSLIGNKHTLSTYPEEYRKKISTVTVSASRLKYIKSSDDYVPETREFLWHYGGGAVHKGLDLVLDVFKKNKNLVLNVIGRLESERDFLKIYEQELFHCSNIRYYGCLFPSSDKFIEIIKRVFCFIAPSCSEGISPAVVTCLQLGLFPIISRNNGITLPNNAGLYLETCATSEIENVVNQAMSLSKDELEDQIASCQSFALKEFSREKFSSDMSAFLGKILV